MRNVIRALMLVDTNERYREVSCVKYTRACHRNVNKLDFCFFYISEF